MKLLTLIWILLLFLIIVVTFLYVKYNQYSSFVDNLDIDKSPDEKNLNYTTPSKREIKLNVFATCYLMAPSYKNYINKMNLSGHEHVLDFGSGAGPSASYIANKLSKGDGELTCLDISPTWMTVIKARLADYNNINFILGDITQLEIEEGIFDKILIHFVLHDIDQNIRNAVISNLATTLKTGGKIYIREPSSDQHGMPSKEIQQLMRDNNLEEIQMLSGRMIAVIPVSEGIYQKNK